ncbi:unnamed protein product, partial [Dracunculus medinensis]|uniref:Sugar transporter SWEET n=1 Tax=Dracunculus medinensis TaxID=318479 RepID=A0A0N4UH17_DRAME
SSIILTNLSKTYKICSETYHFFTYSPICRNIWKRGGTKDISYTPFLMGLIGASFWFRYGLLKMDYTMIMVNIVAVILYSIYSIFYLYMSKEKMIACLLIIIVIFSISLMAFFVQFYGIRTIDILGFTCMMLNIINFGSPLAGLRVVLKRYSCDTLPLPLCIGNLFVSTEWCMYGILVRDIYIIIPNAVGALLGLVQLSLFLLFPIKQGEKAFINIFFGEIYRRMSQYIELKSGWKNSNSRQKHDKTICESVVRKFSQPANFHIIIEENKNSENQQISMFI